ncbi:LysR family transcriptional regulator [Marinomonas sp. S3726]|uniref:LysR family transcriptional regulator n=1 Tax=Marinomonas sp. S3726 TaxID=579484 RepID=UPI0005F9B803|nr:LysR family transcriptional regulator [Marinomonas sp. S3726]KJZ12460.1 LysR family transcriptional regulator [Marinomonas sp. S3726]
MEISELLTFIKVAETASFSDAAEQLFVTQPAVSKRIAALEASLELKLFDRIGRQIQLTEAGHQLLPKAKKIAADIRDIKRSLTTQDEVITGELKMATSHHIGLHRLPKALKQYQNDYPNVLIEIDFTQSEDAYQQVLKGDTEIAVITLSNDENPMIESIPIWSDPLMLVVGQDHELANNESKTNQEVNIEALASMPCVLPDQNTFTRQMVDKVLGSQGLKPNVRMSTNNFDTLTMLVSIGWGWSLLPSTLVNQHHKVLAANDLILERRLGVIYHKQRTLSRSAAAMMSLLEKEISHGHDS